MNDTVNQFLALIKSLPLSKKIGIVFTVALLIAGFVVMFMWTNKPDYQVLYNNLPLDDAGAIVSKLKEKNIPYKIEGNGSVILVPSEHIYDLRLNLAGDGLPNGGNVGFEIFDETGFGKTKFVQELNYRRALQGELARTINRFKEVKSSRVFIVIPKDSLFVEESKPASASIQLDLKKQLSQDKLSSIIHLVSSAVEGLDPGNVTIVDTNGRVIFKGGNSDYISGFLSNAQLEFKTSLENEIGEKVQTMLEGIVGSGRAIVRVVATIDSNKVTLNEEEYDPESAVIRSQRSITESDQGSTESAQISRTAINEKKGIVPPQSNTQKINQRNDITTNFEINKITRSTFQPGGKIKRLSVAAVIDQKFTLEKLDDGSMAKKYIPWSDVELKQFDEIVKKAMGYDEDREDKVTVSSIPFSDKIPVTAVKMGEEKGFDILEILENYKKLLANILLAALIFIFLIRPLLNTLRGMARQEGAINTGDNVQEIVGAGGEYVQIPQVTKPSHKQKVIELTNNNPDRAEQIIKKWISEPESGEG